MANSKNVIDITDNNFADEALRSPVPVLVDFTAAWCPPCRAIAPHVDAIADAYAGQLRVGKCDTDANQKLAAEMDIRGIPTLLLIKGGQVVGQLTGAVPRTKIEDFVRRAL
jgi:thioredoxin 1